MRDSSVSVAALAREGSVTELPGIGKTLEEKLIALDETGDIPAAVKLRAKIPTGLIAVMHLPGLRAEARAAAVRRARRRLARRAARRGRATAGCASLRGFGAKAEENLKQVLADHDAGDGQPAPRVAALARAAVAEQIVERAARAPGGGPRRGGRLAAAAGPTRSRTST